MYPADRRIRDAEIRKFRTFPDQNVPAFEEEDLSFAFRNQAQQIRTCSPGGRQLDRIIAAVLPGRQEIIFSGIRQKHAPSVSPGRQNRRLKIRRLRQIRFPGGSSGAFFFISDPRSALCSVFSPAVHG